MIICKDPVSKADLRRGSGLPHLLGNTIQVITSTSLIRTLIHFLAQEVLCILKALVPLENLYLGFGELWKICMPLSPILFVNGTP